MSRVGLAVKALVRQVSRRTSVRFRFGSAFSSKRLWFNRPLHNAPLPAVSSAPLASDPKRWLQPNPEVLSISCQKTRRCCVWSKPVYFKIDGFWFWWEKTHPKVKADFWDTGPCVDNITGLQLVLSCLPWSDGKGKGQFTSQGGSAVELDLKITVIVSVHLLFLPDLTHLNYHMAFRCLKTHQNSFSPNIPLALCTLNSNKIENGDKMENAAWRICVA